jgi:imidazolonepropionase-like amidohydrolase
VSALRQAGIQLLAGTDVVELGMFVGWSLHRELKLFVQAGLSPWEALATATINAGHFLGKDYGIQPGAEGSVLVLDASPIDDIWNTTKIRMVVHHGQVVQSNDGSK